MKKRSILFLLNSRVRLMLYVMLCIVFSSLSNFVLAQTCDLVVNGNFAAAQSCPEVGFTNPGYVCNRAPGNGTIVVTNNAALINGPWSGVDRLGGTNFLAVDGTNNATPWVQNVHVVAGKSYTYTAWVRNLVNANSGVGIENPNPSVSIEVDGAVIANSGPIAQSAPNVWRQVQGVFVAKKTGSVALSIINNVDGDYNDVGIDDISFVLNVPTPVVSNETICEGKTATLKALRPNHGGTYKWYDVATGGTSIFTGNSFTTPVLNTTTSYWVSDLNRASGCESARVRVDVIVTPLATAPVVSEVSVCSGSSATITAVGGPIINWYNTQNEIKPIASGNTFVTPVLHVSRSYWVSATTPEGCESEKVRVDVTVKPIPAPPTTTNGTNCGCGMIALGASGSTGNFLWHSSRKGGTAIPDNASTDGSSFITPQICTTTSYWVSAVNADGCESRRVHVAAIIITPAVPANLVVNGDFAAAQSCPEVGFTNPGYTCANAPGNGTIVVTNNATLINGPWSGVDRLGGTNFLAVDGTNNATPWLQNVNVVAGESYTYTAWVRNLVNANSGAGIENPTPSVSLEVNGTVIVNSGPIAQSAPNVWRQVQGVYVATVTGTVALSIVNNMDGNYNDVGIDDISFVPAAPKPSAKDVSICSGTTATITATGTIPGYTYVWYATAVGGTSIFVGNPYVTPVLTANTTYWVTLRDVNGCEANRVVVNVVVNPIPEVPAVSDLSICQGLTAMINATGGAPAYNWYSSNTSTNVLFTGNPFVTPVLNVAQSYWVSSITPASCESARVQVNVTVNPKPADPSATGASRCGCGTLDLNVSGSTGNYNWYTTQDAVASVANGPSYTTPQICNTTDYWVSAVSAEGCESNRIKVTATVTTPVAQANLVVNGDFAAAQSCPEVGFTNPGYTCANAPGNGTIVVTNNATLINGPWSGVDRLGGTNFLAVDGTNNATPWVQNVNVVAGTSYTYTVWVRNLVNANSGAGIENPTPSVSLEVNGTVIVNSGPIAQSAPNVWRQVQGVYVATTTGSVALSIVNNMDGNYNDVGIDDISFVPDAPKPVASDVSICSGTTATLIATATGATPGYTYVWYATAVGGTSIYVGNPYTTPVLTANTTYWVTLRDANGCESDRVPVNVTIKATPAAPVVEDVSRCDCGTLTLTASGSTGTYNWFSDAAMANSLGTGSSFTTPSICATTNYYVSATDASGCVSAIGTGTASITGPATTITGPTQVYANGIINYELEISNNSGVDMNNIMITTSLADFVLDKTINPNPFPTGPYSILAGGAPIKVTYRGYFPTAGNIPKTMCFDVVANGCTTEVCKTITNVYAGCPFAWGATTSDCDTETYGPNGVVKTISLSGHNNFYDITKVDFNITYNPSYLAFASADVVPGAPVGTAISTTSVNNSDGTITVNGTVNYGSKVDILRSNGDGDIVIYDVVNLDFTILARPLTTCDMQLPTTGTTFYSALGTVTKPTDYGRITFLCTPCPAISAFFTASPNPVMQGTAVTFTADPTGGAHTWYSGTNNNRQLGSSSPVAIYTYSVPGVYTVTHYRTENGLTGIYQDNVEVCGILTDSINVGVCAGGSISVPFKASSCAAFQANNVFSLELSDASGVFSASNPNIIGTWAGSISGTIVGTIPMNTTAGNGYRVRVLSSSPLLIGTDNGINLTISNCNSGLLFDGVSNRVTIPNHVAYAIGSNDFTMEALVNIPVGAAGNLPLFSKRTSGSDGFLVYVYGNQLLIQMNGVPNYLSNVFTSIRDGKCHHVAITRSGTLITFYVDALSVGTVNSTRSLNSTGPLYIGYDVVDNSSFNGEINEARLWNIARTAAEISANATSSIDAASNGLIGLWRFNEDATQVVVDASTTANNGVLGTNNTVEANTDPQRSVVQCYSSDRHDAASIDKVYNVSSEWNIEVVPNPFVNKTAVSVQKNSTGTDSYDVEVYTMQGLLMERKTLIDSEQLLLGDGFTPGMYLLKVSQNGNTQTVKIIKQ